MTRTIDDEPRDIANTISAPNGRAQVIDLDAHREAGAQFIVTLRRSLREAQTRNGQLSGDSVEALLRQGPARTWREAADRLRHVIEHFSQMPAAQDRRQQRLVSRALRDIAYLTREPAGSQ